ncbi:hypothetical protein TH47_00400 [Thalassospira sp. MCCC 1A02803]|nr:hypothetical protein TH47_00400 [Thalassospira sp. MCCC 1A02803]
MFQTNKAGANEFDGGFEHALTLIDDKLTDLIWGFL